MTRRPRHDWTYKTIYNGKGFWVLCADCGRSDEVLSTEEEARARVAFLRHQVSYRTTGLAIKFPRKLRNKELKKRLRVPT